MSVSPCIAFGLVFSCLLAGNSRAGQFGLFTYEITSATTVSIIDYPDGATGPVVIPASIDGRSVTEIGSAAFSEAVGIVSVEIPNSIVTINNDAFALCTSLASVTFAPASSVTSLGPAVFNGCSALTSISIPSGVERIEDMLFRGCSSLTHVSLPSGVESIGEESFGNCIVLGNFTFPASLTSIGNSAFETCDGLTDVRLPANLTSLGPFAFFDCDGLTTVSIPASVTSIGNSAFVGCALLTSANFLGDAPAMGDTVFDNQTSNPHLRIYFFKGKSGFTTPEWIPLINQPALRTVELEFTDPVVAWLVSNNLPVDSDLASDANADGVSLLMAYALNLNPSLNLASSIPRPVLTATQLTLSFHGAAPGVTYSVESSTNLASWTTEGVMLTGPDANQMRTASVSRTEPLCFLRLKVAR
jgi:hypothetical protein